MFVLKSQLPQHVGKCVKVIGKLVHIETPDLVISTADGNISVVFNDLHRYTDKMVIVTGTVQEDLKIVEEFVDDVPEGLCLETYAKMVKLSGAMSEIFH